MPAKRTTLTIPKGKLNPRNLHHGHTWRGGHTKTYGAWNSMKNRCYCKTVDSYHRYGGRGITVCDRWINSFENFLEDMGECPPGLTLERRDNDKNYTKSNCAWDTVKVQNRNKSTNHRLKFIGQSRPIVEWAEILGRNEDTILSRINMGWSASRALTQPIRKPTKCRMFGRINTIYGWWKESGIGVTTVLARIKRGWTLKRALTTLPNGSIWSP